MNISKVTVIVPVYNKEIFIHSLLDTIYSQSMLPSEVIFIDDGSEDESYSLLLEQQSKYKFILEKNSVNVGVSVSRNKGLSLARNELIAFLDADDYWDKDFLKKMVKTFESNNCDILGSCYSYDNKGERTRAKIYGLDTERNITFINDYYKLACRGEIPFTSSSVLLKRSIALQCGGFPEHLKMGEDQVLWSYLVEKYRAAIFHENLASYRVNVLNSACDSVFKGTFPFYTNYLCPSNSFYYHIFIIRQILYGYFFLNFSDRSTKSKRIEYLRHCNIKLGLLLKLGIFSIELMPDFFKHFIWKYIEGRRNE